MLKLRFAYYFIVWFGLISHFNRVFTFGKLFNAEISSFLQAFIFPYWPGCLMFSISVVTKSFYLVFDLTPFLYIGSNNLTISSLFRGGFLRGHFRSPGYLDHNMGSPLVYEPCNVSGPAELLLILYDNVFHSTSQNSAIQYNFCTKLFDP